MHQLSFYLANTLTFQWSFLIFHESISLFSNTFHFSNQSNNSFQKYIFLPQICISFAFSHNNFYFYAFSHNNSYFYNLIPNTLFHCTKQEQRQAWLPLSCKQGWRLLPPCNTIIIIIMVIMIVIVTTVITITITMILMIMISIIISINIFIIIIITVTPFRCTTGWQPPSLWGAMIFLLFLFLAIIIILIILIIIIMTMIIIAIIIIIAYTVISTLDIQSTHLRRFGSQGILATLTLWHLHLTLFHTHHHRHHQQSYSS